MLLSKSVFTEIYMAFHNPANSTNGKGLINKLHHVIHEERQIGKKKKNKKKKESKRYTHATYIHICMNNQINYIWNIDDPLIKRTYIEENISIFLWIN